MMWEKFFILTLQDIQILLQFHLKINKFIFNNSKSLSDKLQMIEDLVFNAPKKFKEEVYDPIPDEPQTK